MSPPDLVIRSRRVIFADPPGEGEHRVGPAAIAISKGKILAVGEPGDFRDAREDLDAGDAVVMAGLVDAHVHVNEPGRAEWEGFETATRAAAAGGITALVDMPLNSSPVTTTAAAFEAKAAAAEGKCRVDVAFWGGVVPGNAADLEPLARAGVRGFKCFLVHSGIDEFPNVAEADLREAMPVLARLGLPLLAHCEVPGPIEAARGPADLGKAERGSARTRARSADAGPMRRYADYLASRPPAAEDEAIALLIRLARETRCRVHVVHLSSAGALPLLRAARAEGLPVTVETCPHYLAISAEEVPDGATPFKCAPPIREAANRDALWAALDAGLIDMVQSDHSPCPPGMKRAPPQGDGDFARAWGGIASLEIALPVVWTEAARRGIGLERLPEWMARRPARLAGLSGLKGEIAPGRDADLVVWNPEERFTVDPQKLQHRHKITPYAGRPLHGRVEMTYVRGRLAYGAGRFPGEPGGALLAAT